MDGDLAHAVDHIVEVVGQAHAVGNVEAQDEDIVEKLVDVIDDGVAAMLVVDDAGEVLSAGFAKVGGARDRYVGELQQELRKLADVRRTGEPFQKVRQEAHARLSSCALRLLQAAC